ncbi:40-residue YVTN family beta-propeller repeat-containing protein [Granulicella rosea]|uniref:40-residue YVTN family beta-propeller repeat-containing protein n=1 Tax=Granulicella rosea TaxID=474952 RepID=A0A239H1F8_9BACT|nr:YncE family protein [Granulicella rosea]SNS75259.1 40-residue YVTN family beta-propeller repeat-containing protein [Granulicella rosea]
MKMPLRLAAVGVLAGCALAPAGLAAQAGPYAVVDKWVLGGEGGWDYLLADSANHLLYVTHATRVEVVDTTTGKPVGAITGLKGTHGVVLDDEGKYGFISDGGGNVVVVFDRKTFAIVNRIPAGTNPDGMAWEPSTKTVWAFNGRSSDVTVIDAVGMKTVATIKLSGKPEFPAVDGKGAIWVNIETKNTLVKLDAKTLKQTAEWPLAGCESPSGLAIDREHRHLFSVCDGRKMPVTDGDTGRQIALVTIGEGPDAAAYDAKDQLAFSSNGEGTLSIVSTAGGKFTTLQTLPTQATGRTMAFDFATGKAYVVVAKMGPKPAPTAATPKPRATALPGTFTVLVIAKK